jgi:hypothetical protein
MTATQIIICTALFVFLFWFNYIGAKGRIEGVNQFTGQNENLGRVTSKEQEAINKNKTKLLAIKQAFLGAIVWTLIVAGLMLIF